MGQGVSSEVAKMYVFGDSFSDNGNLFAVDPSRFPYVPYGGPRFSNGRLSVEYLNELLGFGTLEPSEFIGKPQVGIKPVGENYAVVGARTDPFGSSNPIHFDSQVSAFLFANDQAVPPDVLIMTFLGANDVVVAGRDLQTAWGTGLDLPPLKETSGKKGLSKDSKSGKKDSPSGKKESIPSGKSGKKSRRLGYKESKKVGKSSQILPPECLLLCEGDPDTYEYHVQIAELFDWEQSPPVDDFYTRLAQNLEFFVGQVQILVDNGGQYFFVVNVPNFGITPELQKISRGLFEASTTEFDKLFSAALPMLYDQAALKWNDSLEQALGGWENLLIFDAYTASDINREAFEGNSEDACINFPSQGFPLVVNPECPFDSTPSIGFWFWDDVHITTTAHAISAESFAEAIVEWAEGSEGGSGKKKTKDGRF